MPTIDSKLVPVSIAQQIIAMAAQQSVVLQLGQRQPMPTGVVNVPFLKTLPVSGWVNGVGGRKPATSIEWSAETITTEEVAAIIAVPQATIDDSGIPIWPNVQNAIADSVAFSVDSAVLFGDNAPPSFPAGGIFGQGTAAAPGPARVVHTQTTDPPDLAQAILHAEADVEDRGLMSTGYAADIAVSSRLRGLRDTVGQPIFVPNLAADSPPTLWGDPLYFSASGAFDHAKCDVIAGAWNMLIVGVRQDMTVDMSTEGVITDDTGNVVVNAFQDDQVLMRVHMRLGYVIGQPVSRRTGVPTFPFGFAAYTGAAAGGSLLEAPQGDEDGDGDAAPSAGNGGSRAKAGSSK